MFDFDVGKLLIIGIIALIVIGPKELPGVMRQVGQAVAKMRRMAGEFQSQFMEAMREADVEDLRKDVEKIVDTTKREFDPLGSLKAEKEALETLDAHVQSLIGETPLVEPIPDYTNYEATLAQSENAPILPVEMGPLEVPKAPEPISAEAAPVVAPVVTPPPHA